MENEHLALMSASQRVGCLLLQMSSGMLGKGGTFAFPYDKALAASRLTMKPETFSRALAQLKDAGVSVKGPEVTMESFAALVEFCCGDCSAMPGECCGSRSSCDNKSCSANITLKKHRSASAKERAALRTAAAMSAKHRPRRTREGENARRLP